jgi:hypothetical protein
LYEQPSSPRIGELTRLVAELRAQFAQLEEDWLHAQEALEQASG